MLCCRHDFGNASQGFTVQAADMLIAVILVSGDSDTVVNFEENGLFLKKAYEEAGIPLEVYIKKGGDHHPHGLSDNTPIADFILKYDK